MKAAALVHAALLVLAHPAAARYRVVPVTIAPRVPGPCGTGGRGALQTALALHPACPQRAAQAKPQVIASP